ncbi:uncharacterized protein MONOS_14545 [Monocercomonoides exilis]|uniref:uncharacterized protein n=1 Tax=Monocercomonoides exilis TaxID=2049356 RepID=UPI00355AAEF4|nr:hypothetical protein MONOS_14545 [Monocercomonoides exilis]|eukprot:MONOS_14545.1-p1 / transcript=MONOS_14545.1 / gene=MONOS_14545 / organism=Monocercomonoides_exilis_PA203 / gene_product=unspecified product / transcript_product=unspecified product / location=Mono_scaffold01021:14520-15005(+) / protein_length=162 / sequence_SO=supercontig / SO=protein_coding / is_pseudo=false
MMVFGLITISSLRLVLCEFETLGKVESTIFLQIKCTGCVIVGGEKGSGDGRCVKISSVQEEAVRQFALEHVVLTRYDSWKGRNVFASDDMLLAVVDAAHINWNMPSADISSLDEPSGFVLAESVPNLPLSFSTSTSPPFLHHLHRIPLLPPTPTSISAPTP